MMSVSTKVPCQEAREISLRAGKMILGKSGLPVITLLSDIVLFV